MRGGEVLAVYLGALALGGVLIGASALLGGGDSDAGDGDGGESDAGGDSDAGGADHDHSHDHVHADHAGSDPWLPFLSLRFWTFALASFGLAGTLLHVIGWTELLSGPVSAVFGLAVGTGVSWAFRKLGKDQVSGSVGMRHLQGREGRLLLPVSAAQPGKVRLLVDGQDVDLVARTRDDRPIEAKQPVLVVEVKDGVAEVTSIPKLGDAPQGEKEE